MIVPPEESRANGTHGRKDPEGGSKNRSENAGKFKSEGSKLGLRVDKAGEVAKTDVSDN